MKPTADSSAQPRVLLVDDNDAILERARALLSSACAVVAIAKDGLSALRAAEVHDPDVIVLDISMPEMTGFEVARELRRLGARAAIVFLTVHADEDFVTAANAVGVKSYVVKPRLGVDLLHAVEEAHAGRGFVSAFR